ncbi:hypothetical protein M8J76_015326 [Diaphorina citri]|nr:hypothetical protein M8J75_016011 [Diaphorina citri]KAI5745898.1 hypothetical protein M8J76_015326 [Diaphorina citri]
MIESLDHSDKLMTDLGLFSSESVLLDLDSHLSFENIPSWIHDDIFSTDLDKLGTQHDKDHTYSQRAVSNIVEELGDNGAETDGEVEMDCTPTIPFRRNECDIGSGDARSKDAMLDGNENDDRCCKRVAFPQDTIKHDGDTITQLDTLSDQITVSADLEDRKSTVQPMQQPGTSLSFLLDETTNLNIDLDNLLRDEFEANNPTLNNLHESTNEADPMRLVDSFGVNSDRPLGIHTSHDYSLATLDEQYGDHRFLATYNETQGDECSLTNLDFASAFDTVSSSHWTSPSSGSTELTSDLTLNWEDTSASAPLSLEEMFTRAFNEELDKVPLHGPECYDQYQYEQSDVSAQWSDVRWDSGDGYYSEYLESLQLSGNTEGASSPGMSQMGDSCTVENLNTGECQNSSELINLPVSPGSTEQSSDRNEHLSRNELRLAQVRKYQRMKKSNSENLVRTFQCTYPDCLKFYAKMSHLKAHLRRHSGERSFKCDWQDCKWQFSRSDELSRHRRSHFGIKPYPCTLCVKKFTRSDHLAKHLKVHERQKYKMMMKSMRKMKNKK